MILVRRHRDAGVGGDGYLDTEVGVIAFIARQASDDHGREAVLLVRRHRYAGVGGDGRLDTEVGVIAFIARPGFR